MDWHQLLTVKRYGHEDAITPGLGRSHFHKDHDRIIFSSAFRRLGRKTQVHPLALNDHIHTRLTHSIEVGSVGRSLGVRVGTLLQDQLPDWVSADDIGLIVQSACLAHDIGNPPFGHAGEYVIRDWFQQTRNEHYCAPLSEAERLDLQTFEGNAQGFRVVTCIENHLYDGGLRLTYPTLGTLLKYPWTVQHAGAQGKFGCYQADSAVLDKLGSALGLVAKGSQRWCRHPLAYLLEAADDICYAILDLEDAIELNILSFETVKPILLQLCGDQQFEDQVFYSAASARRKISALRGKAIEYILDSVVSAFMQHYPAIMAGEYQGELLLDGHPDVRDGVRAAKQLARERVFPDTRKTELEVGAYSCLGVLLEAFCEAVYEQYCHQSGRRLSYRSEKIISLMGIHAPHPEWPLYQAYIRALDFISGMTDNYAVYLAKQFGIRH